MENYIVQCGLGNILDKVKNDVRLDLSDGEQLYKSNDILAVGYLADIVRKRLNGDDAFFIYNQHINYSNVCTNLCKFCAFGREKGTDLAYEMSVHDVKEKVRERLDEPITEIHMVGGLHPELPFDYYLEVLKGIKSVRPDVHIQAFTCVEIAHFSELCGKSIEDTLGLLMDAGLGSMPGGGAEVFSPRIRQLTCERKLSGEKWLEIASIAHKCGLHSNATMLYGHIETIEERLEHLDALRRTQDETQGFLAFIPLAFHPQNTAMDDLSRTTGVNDLKNIAVARLMLDNFQHIKAYWVMIGPQMAQIALTYGADDLDGTVKEEVITHMAGAETEQTLTSSTLIKLIHEVGRRAVQRDTLYNVIETYE